MNQFLDDISFFVATFSLSGYYIYLRACVDNKHTSFFQLQVWKNDGVNQRLFKSDDSDDSGPSMRLEKIGVNKNRIYCTIDCDKGLKVQKLFLIGILKLKNVYYISENTYFPPPSSKRKMGSADPNSDDFIQKGMPLSHQYHDKWQILGDAMEDNSTNGRTNFYYLTRSVEFAADIDGRELHSIKGDVYDWLKVGSMTLDEKIRFGVVDNIIEIWLRGFFFGIISSATSTRLLTDIFNKTGEGHFLIRFSMTRRPFFDLEGFYADHTTGEPTFYKALIMYDIDPMTKKVIYWIDTRNDTKTSRSLTLLNVLSYVSLTTRWKALSTDFYDKNGLPCIDTPPVVNTTINSSTAPSEFSNSVVTSINANNLNNNLHPPPMYYQIPTLPSSHVNKADMSRGWQM